jgi:two-component system sensor histidine kinase KdpD
LKYKTKTLSEFDLDAALKRHPGLILIDEMAHTNVAGLRHLKRWQDIKEILDRGIDVYTTLNVQHIESLNDVVSQIIQIRIQETVPDLMLESADIIELVDLSPEDLLKRLHEGKVYFPTQIKVAKKNFFRKGNLIALRELALRTTAERVEAQVLLYRQGEGIKRIWPTNEKILVCVGPQPESIKLIRTARRLATSLQADWIAVYVETARLGSSETKRRQAIQHLRFAESLGAETHIITGFDIVNAIMDFARAQNVTQIMLWKKIHSRWRNLFFRSLSDEIVRRSQEIDIYIVTGEGGEIKQQKTTAPSLGSSGRFYGFAMAIVAAVTGINLLLYPFLPTSNLIMLYLLGIILIALMGKVGPSVLASIVSVLAYDFFFVTPRFSFMVTGVETIFTLIIMLLMGQLFSYLTIFVSRQAKMARDVEQQTAALHKLSRKLASKRGANQLLRAGVHYIGEIFNCEVAALLLENDRLVVRARYRSAPKLNSKERSVAQWVFDLGQMAGMGTDTLASASALYLPLLAPQGNLGVLRIHPLQADIFFSPPQMHLLQSCASQLALVLETDFLEEKNKKLELKTQTDRMQKALLKSVSHLEAQTVFLKKELHSLEDMIATVMKIIEKTLKNRHVHVHLADNLPHVPCDNILMQEVFINLIDNAIKFTPEENAIEISASVEKNEIIVSIINQGINMTEAELDQFFSPYQRDRLLDQTKKKSQGLGLAICRSIVLAHGGEIWVENKKEGTIFRFSLPLHGI